MSDTPRDATEGPFFTYKRGAYDYVVRLGVYGPIVGYESSAEECDKTTARYNARLAPLVQKAGEAEKLATELARLSEVVCEVVQEDIRKILLALGLGDHARPKSCHEVVNEEIIPAINLMRVRLDRAIDAAWEKK